MEKLFSYGTLQQENVQLDTFGRKLEGQKDSLPGYRLGEIRISNPEVIRASGKEYHPILIATDDPEDQVQGSMFLITPEELAQADSYEVKEYQRVAARLTSGDTAWIYAAAEDFTRF